MTYNEFETKFDFDVLPSITLNSKTQNVESDMQQVVLVDKRTKERTKLELYVRGDQGFIMELAYQQYLGEKKK